jgi:hypothetical protein
MVLAFWIVALGLGVVNYTTFGYSPVTLISGAEMRIAMDGPSIIVLRYRPQNDPWLTAHFEESEMTTMLDARDDVMISSQKVSLSVTGANFPNAMDMWILNEYLCPM